MNALLLPVAAVLCAAAVLAQTGDPVKALARAQLLEQHETDLAAAEQAYRALLADTDASAVHAESALRLGTLLWRLDKKHDGKSFLERAVAAGGEVAARATLVMQGQDEAGKQAQERLEKARLIVSRLDDLVWNKKGDDPAILALCDQLSWLGDGAATVLVEQLTDLDKRSEIELQDAAGNPVPNWATFARLLWRIGGPPAAGFLGRIADSPNLAARRFVTATAQKVRIADNLEPALVRFAQDPDPTGEVWQNVQQAIASLPVDHRAALVNHPHVGVQAAALHGLAGAWPTVPNQEAWVREHEVALRAALRSPDGRLARGAWSLAAQFLRCGPRLGTELVLEALPEVGEAFVELHGAAALVEGSDAWMHLLAETARKLGPTDPDGSRRASVVTFLLNNHNPAWTAAAVDDVVALIELGHGRGSGAQGDTWIRRAVQLASTSQLKRLIALLPRITKSLDGTWALANRPLPLEVYPELRDLLMALLDDRIEPWREKPTRAEQPRRDGRLYTTLQATQAQDNLLNGLVRTRAPEAADWLTEQALRRPQLAQAFTVKLLLLSQNDVPAAKKGLRTLLAWPGTDEVELPPHLRSQVFAELARVGDVEAIPLFPRAYELGVQQVSVSAPDRSMMATGIGFLADISSAGRVVPHGPFHGYGNDDLVTAWRTLLDSPATDEVWEELGSTVPGRNNRPGRNAAQGSPTFSIPVAVLPLVCERLPARWRKATTDDVRRELENNVLRAFARVTPEVATNPELATAVRKLLNEADPLLATSLFQTLPIPTARAFDDEARRLLRRSPWKWLITRLVNAGIELPIDDWRALLQEKEYTGLVDTLKSLPQPLAASLRAEIEATLRHEHAFVRTEACKTMQRLFATDAVAALLPLLQDSTDDVRKTARTCLDQLREEHERRAYWADAKTGIDISPAGAAVKLLAQAKAGEAREQRVLAIRSLAVLGAPESLPYLIDWTKDLDHEVATAARDAILQIHRRSGPGGSEKK